MKKFSISVFFPVYNDEKTIPKLVADVVPILKRISDDYEVILVNDCSTDNSAKVVEQLAKKYPHVRTIHHEHNMGYGGSLKSGIYGARKEWVFYTDGDGQYDVAELEKLVPWMGSADLVNGYKISRSDSYMRRIAGFAYKKFINFMFRINIQDVDCDFRLMRRNIFDSITLTSDSGFIDGEMIAKLRRKGVRVKDVPVHHYPRLGTVSQFFKVDKIIEVFIDMGKQWWRINMMDD